ncbi:MAG: hypothetical protein EXS05_04220 [Planctomycetaceae bacterium]|nr:hypothetical protein [Planctomycetaceae bacterium]
MPQPLVIAYHLVWTAYGWWLPNDPRGSMSHWIADEEIERLGEAHYGRKPIQPSRSTVRQFHQQAAETLQYPLLKFEPAEFEIVAAGLARSIEAQRYTCYAAAVMPEHIHLVIRKHRDKAEEMIAKLQSVSRLHVMQTGLHDTSHPVWTTGGHKGFIDNPDRVRTTIRYIERNPVEDGLPAQHWPFVSEYDGWPLHAGHSPNSPYARGLREARQRRGSEGG